jgi:hypothetical protein
MAPAADAWRLLTSRRVACWCLPGLVFGATMRLVGGAPPVPRKPDSGETALRVVLKSDKYVTLTLKERPLPDIVEEVSAQTGQRLRTDPSLRTDLITGSVLFHRVPLLRVLNVVAYISGGAWRREGDGLTLRPRAPYEVRLGADRQRELMAEVIGYLRGVNPDDPSLPSGAGNGLRELRQAADPKTMLFTGSPETAIKDGTVEVEGGFLKIVYRGPDGEDVSVWN